MRPIFYPYNMRSRSCRLLARSFPNSRRVWPDRNYKPHRNHIIVNWGNTTLPDWGLMAWQQWVNPIDAVRLASSKLLSFQLWKEVGVSIPEFTTSYHEAYDWGTPVMVRHLTRANSGRGAVFVDRDERELLLGSQSTAPLYVRYMKKSREERVHIMNGEVIDVQAKRVRRDSEGNNFQIRNYGNGWVFCRDNVADCVRRDELASLAVSQLGLDFGAVDMIYNAYYDRWYVLEVNTAPGLEGSSVDVYHDSIAKLL